MSARKVNGFTHENRRADIFFEYYNREYRIKFYENDCYLKDADYFTDDVEDALGTAKHWVNQADVMGDHNGRNE